MTYYNSWELMAYETVEKFTKELFEIHNPNHKYEELPTKVQIKLEQESEELILNHFPRFLYRYY